MLIGGNETVGRIKSTQPDCGINTENQAWRHQHPLLFFAFAPFQYNHSHNAPANPATEGGNTEMGEILANTLALFHNFR
jgi:hypothetical protein